MDIRRIADGEVWDRLVLGFPNADPRQSYAWGEVRRTLGWAPFRFAAFADGQCVAALSVSRRCFSGVGALVYAPRGPIMDFEGDRGWTALRPLVEAAADAADASFVRVSPALPHDRVDVLSRFVANGFVAVSDFWPMWNTPRNVMTLDVSGSETELLGRMAKRRRRHIATAAEHDVSVELRNDLDALSSFYTLQTQHAGRLGYPVRDWAYYAALHGNFAPSDGFAVIFGRVRDELVCAVLAVRFGPITSSLYAPSRPALRGTPAGEAVHWALIRWARQAGCRVIDFGCSGTHMPPRRTEVHYGLYQFKSELGCRLELNVPYQDYVRTPLRYRMARALEQRVLPRARPWLARVPAPLRTAIARRTG